MCAAERVDEFDDAAFAHGQRMRLIAGRRVEQFDALAPATWVTARRRCATRERAVGVDPPVRPPGHALLPRTSSPLIADMYVSTSPCGRDRRRTWPQGDVLTY